MDSRIMPRRVLLIEDNEQNRYLTTFLLEKNGYTVVVTSDGQSGIEMARTMLPSIILLDIQLPKMDGYDVAKAIRRVASLHETRIIAVTSYAMPGDREKALAAGCDGYIEKPINPDTFIDEIENIMMITNAGEGEA